MQCKEWDDANSELFKESHDEAVHKNSYKSGLYELISASLDDRRCISCVLTACGAPFLRKGALKNVEMTALLLHLTAISTVGSGVEKSHSTIV